MGRRRRTLLAFVLLVAMVVTTSACASRANPGETPTALTGAGASFPAPLYERWLDQYSKVNEAARIEYQSIGSGGGIQQITMKTVDFGASDAPMTQDELDAAPGKLLHIPTTMGAVAITYNLPDGPKELDMTGQVLVDIFDAKITKWNDAAIAELNPDASLPDKDIAVVHRSDSSGTTYIFTSYVATVDTDWTATKSPEWPVGIGAKGNEGVAGQISQTPYSLGYVELAYAVENDLPLVALENKAGNFVRPSLEGISAAAAGLPEDAPFTSSIIDADGPNTYPIAAFTYLLVYQDMDDATKARALVNFIDWAIHDGQQYNEGLLYAKLPEALVDRIEETLQSITANGQPIE